MWCLELSVHSLALPCESPSRKEGYSVISVLHMGELRFGQENNLPEDTLLASGASWETGPGAKVGSFSPHCYSGAEGVECAGHCLIHLTWIISCNLYTAPER